MNLLCHFAIQAPTAAAFAIPLAIAMIVCTYLKTR